MLSAGVALRADHHHRLAGARVKGIKDPSLRRRTPGSMTLLRAAPARPMSPPPSAPASSTMAIACSSLEPPISSRNCRPPGAIFLLPASLAKLDKFDCLILDDLGYVRKDQAETAVLFELIAERYERKSLIITCNQPFSEWDKVFPDPAVTVAAIDRLVHHATILEINTESYRRRTALDKAAPPRKLPKAPRLILPSPGHPNRRRPTTVIVVAHFYSQPATLALERQPASPDASVRRCSTKRSTKGRAPMSIMGSSCISTNGSSMLSRVSPGGRSRRGRTVSFHRDAVPREPLALRRRALGFQSIGRPRRSSKTARSDAPSGPRSRAGRSPPPCSGAAWPPRWCRRPMFLPRRPDRWPQSSAPDRPRARS